MAFLQGASSKKEITISPAITPPNVATIVPPAAKASLIEFRTKLIPNMFKRLSFVGTDPSDLHGHKYSFFTVDDILYDWALHNPERLQLIKSEFNEYLNLKESIRNYPSEDQYYFWRSKQNRINELAKLLRDFIIENPWSTFDINRVFGKRIALIEFELSEEMNVEIGDLWRAVDHLTRDFKREILYELLSESNTKASPIIYSQIFIDRFVAKLREIAPRYAEKILERQSYENLKKETKNLRWRNSILAHFAVDTQKVIFHFEFPSENLYQPIVLKDHARKYISLLKDLNALKLRFESTLLASPFKIVLLDEMDSLISDAKMDLSTLPQKVRAYNQMIHDIPDYSSSILKRSAELPDPDSPKWKTETFLSHQETVGEILSWAHYLRDAGIVLTIINIKAENPVGAASSEFKDLLRDGVATEPQPLVQIAPPKMLDEAITIEIGSSQFINLAGTSPKP
jgi:hypothetical protein